MSFAVASAEVDITPAPAENPYLAGYGSQITPRVVSSDTPRRALTARCIVLWSEDQPRAFVSVDLLGIPRSVNRRLRPRLRQLAGWTDADVILQATHTHNGPVLVEHLHPFAAYGMSEMTRVRRYSERLEDTVVELVRTALQAPRTVVTLDYRVTSASFAYNRTGLSYVETAVPVLVARAADGRPRAVVFGYGAHPTAAGLRSQWDGDFPAAACEAVERAHPACAALFVQGAAGDQGPSGITGFALSDALGAELGAIVVRAVGQPGRPLTGPVTGRMTEFPLPLAISTDPQTLATFRAGFAERIRNPLGYPAYYIRHAELMVSRIDTGNVETSVPLVAQAWTFGGTGPLRLLLTSGELVSGYAAYFRARFGGTDRLWVGGYANELPCYIPSDEFFPPSMTAGSYEGGWCADFPALGCGNMAAYGWAAPFRHGPGGVEPAVIAGVTSLLS